MDDTALNDLTQKIRNVCRDFELEHDARTGNTINVQVDVSGNTITARILATGGTVTHGVNYLVGEPGPSILSAALPRIEQSMSVEDMLSDREKEDYRKRKK